MSPHLSFYTDPHVRRVSMSSVAMLFSCFYTDPHVRRVSVSHIVGDCNAGFYTDPHVRRVAQVRAMLEIHEFLYRPARKAGPLRAF